MKINGKEVTMRDIKVKDYKYARMQAKDADGNYDPEDVDQYLISNLTGISPDEIDELDLDIYLQLKEELKKKLSK